MLAFQIKFLRKYFQKDDQILQKNLIFYVSAQIYAFIRPPKKLKKNQEKRAEGLKFRLEKIEERVEFIKQNLHNKFKKLANFTKVQCLFRYYDANSGKCTCKISTVVLHVNTLWLHCYSSKRLKTLTISKLTKAQVLAGQEVSKH